MTWRTALLVVAGLTGCSTHQIIPEGYRVTGYDAKSGEWTLVRTGTWDGERQVTRLTVVCEFYKWADREAVKGPEACDLTIGRLLPSDVSAVLQKDTASLSVTEMPGYLSIHGGVGDESVRQGFTIVKNELLSNDGRRAPR